MSWRDQLQKPTFRGVPFNWKRSDVELGRRTARHDYPLRDDSWFEDLGLFPREFTLEAYVVGPEYMDQRDRLIVALETAGPGALAHPTHGTIQVQVIGKVKLSESTDEGGLARFTITFARAGMAEPPRAKKPTAAAVNTAAKDLQEKSATDTTAKLAAAKTATATATKLSAAQKIINAVSAVTGKINAIRGAVSSAMQTVTDVQNSINDLIAAPALLVQGLQGVIAELGTLMESPFDAFNLYQGLFSYGDDSELIPRTSASQVAAADTQDALVALVRTTAIGLAAEVATTIDFTNYQEAIRVRDLLTTAIEAVIDPEESYAGASGYGISDDVYLALTALKSAVVTDIAARGANLARLVSFTPAATLPALLIAYQLYGDANRADELITRNRIAHPGFVPGGTALEVLNV